MIDQVIAWGKALQPLRDTKKVSKELALALEK